MNYSLLLPTLNRPKLVKRFLHSVIAQTCPPTEVVVIDQSDSKDTRDIFETWHAPGIKKTYHHSTIKSLINARNTALDICGDSNLVAFFDDDIILKPNFCEHMLSVFEKDTAHQYAGGMGTIIGSTYNFKPFQTLFLMPREGSGKFTLSGSPTLAHWKTNFCEVEFLSGGLTFWRKKILEQYRYDMALMKGFGHGDDVDISYRVSRKHKLFYQPKSKCTHDLGAPGKDNSFIYRKSWIQNFYYLAKKNRISRLAFYWCVLGHILRDISCINMGGLKGDFVAIRNILTNRVDTLTDVTL